MSSLGDTLDRCLLTRAGWLDAPHESAFRLFNGFLEGLPDLVIDVYARTAILTNYSDPPEPALARVETASRFLQARLPWLRACILKTRNSRSAAERRGSFLYGDSADDKVREHGVWYAVNPVMHQDAGLYLDTRNLRHWALGHLKGSTVLNSFAYTGSLGVAALAGGARRVVQLDRNRAFLRIARRSCELNGFPAPDQDFVAADFFRKAGAFRQQGLLFDCVFLDPPFFSTGKTGTVDQLHQSARLINKVRPLVADGGVLVAVNNAVFVSGQDYMRTLQRLCADGYLELTGLVPVPDDFAGYPDTRTGVPITDSAPFNHSTKIAILRVKRKTK